MPDNESEITLGVLNAIHENAQVTQRSVASELGIALGLANAYLKRCAKKGLIKIQQIPANRYAYYLTPQGFAEKTRLTTEYLSQGFLFFRLARTEFSDIYTECQSRGWRRVALAGLSDLAEIAVLCAAEHDIELIGIIDEETEKQSFAGIPVVPDLSRLERTNAVIVTEMEDPQAAFERLCGVLPADRVLTPSMLNVTRDKQDYQT
jgi:DNA-binding MarR family transcriptional regulator